jgi:hypothetical protein
MRALHHHLEPPLGRARREALAWLRAATLAALLAHAALDALAQPNAGAAARCGQVVALLTHGLTSTRYTLAYPPNAPAPPDRVALVLLPGGGGHITLDDSGCARSLTNNSLVRSLAHFHAAGFATALVDAPSDHPGDNGLAGFRTAIAHAEDLGKVIADVRARTGGDVWLVGTSRGSISAVNAASRLTGPSAPDGVVLTSAVMSGAGVARKAWVVQTVFDLPLESIGMPVLVVGHAADRCVRSPANLMDRITARTNGLREQVATVAGGPGTPGAATIEACEALSPHGFVDQEAEVAAGIARFIRGGRY